MAKRKISKLVITHLEVKNTIPKIKWYWYVRKKGFLQPIPYKYKLPNLEPLIEYSKKSNNANFTKSD